MVRLAVRRWEIAGLAVYAIALGVALLAPTSGTQSHLAGLVVDLAADVGAPAGRVTQARAEFLCNALIVVPVSALGSLVWPRTRWQDWTAWAFVGASLVELTQGVLLPARTASYADIVANTLGALLGALVVLASRALRRTR
jgi:hypothetical protein